MSASDPILDEAVLDELTGLGRELGQDVLGEVANAFRALATSVRAELHAALGERAFARVKRAAHTLKGGSAQIGARRVNALARTLEAEASGERGEQLAGLVERLGAALDEVEAVLPRSKQNAP